MTDAGQCQRVSGVKIRELKGLSPMSLKYNLLESFNNGLIT